METLPCLQDVEMIWLSRDIPHTSYSQLCHCLGYSYNLFQTILANHRLNYNDAMMEILIKWNTKQEDTSLSRSILARKLHDAELGELEKKLSKGEYLPRQHEPHEQEATPLQSISDIYSEKISESLTVQQCRKKLEKKYLDQLCKIQMKPWDRTDYVEFEDMHTVITMVKRDALGKDRKKKEILKGSVAEIFSTKVNGRLPARILLSAPAGRGKTTAVAKMAYDWVHMERGSALEHLPLLFVVKFRNTSQHTTIGEAIKSQLLSDVDDLTPEGLESFIKKNQGICHIILDGIDECAGIFSSQSSSLSNIVSVIRLEEFPECRVLVTTRPHLEKFFNQDELPKVYITMWIEGFSQASSREYIDKFFASTSNPQSRHGHGLKVYLDDQPLIDELVKTPLFCLMICHLWSEGLLDSNTTTQTQLLDNVNVFLMYHANARSKPRVKITPKKLREIISQIGEVALTGLLDDSKKIVFTPHDFRKVPAILDTACELGIVSKTTVYITRLPQSKETTSTTIEFYHKLAQEHSAGKFLAHQTNHFLLRLKISKLDRVLRKIEANTGDYENLIRFAAGSDNSLCIRIMEGLLANSRLSESERYRIALDCSSEYRSTEGNVAALVQRCVNAERILLKAPTAYTVVGMQYLPKQLKWEVRSVKLEGSTLTTDMTSRLWSCLQAFWMLKTLTISDSSLSFPPSPPELLSVTKLSADKVTSQSYEGVLSSIPAVRDIDVSIDVAETSHSFDITTVFRPMSQTRARDEQSYVHIRLHAQSALSTERKIESGETIGGLSLLFEDQTKNQQRLHVSGVKGRDEEALVDLFVKTKQLTYLNSWSGGDSLNKTNGVQNTRLKIEQCKLSTEMIEKLWSSLRSFTPLNQLAISDSFLRFPPSPPELPYVKKLSTERVSSQSYEGLLSSLPGLAELDITLNDAQRDLSQITACLRRTIGQQLTIIRLKAPTSLPLSKKEVSRDTLKGLGLLIREHTKNLQWLGLSGMKCLDEEDLVELVESLTYLEALDSLHLQSIDYGSFNYDKQSDVQWLYFTRREHEKVLEGSARRTEEVLPSTTKRSPGSCHRPPASTSVDIPLRNASVAAGEVSISQARQNEEVMKVILASGDEPDALINEGKGALHDACFKGDLKAIKLLINAGADVDMKSTNNSTPLLLAAEYGHQSCVKELISHGADPTQRDNDGDSLVHAASLGGSLETLKFIIGLEGMSELISSKNNVGQLPLHSAAKEGNIDCVELLLAQDSRQEEGENSCSLIDEQDCQGRTPLYLAVEGGFPPVIDALIEAKADLDIQTNDGKTCLHLAVTLWSIPPNPDKKVQTTKGTEPSNHNSTPVLLAVEYSHHSCVEKLIAHGADPMKRDNDGDSLVHVASLGGRSETLVYVLDLEGMLKLISSKNNAGHLPLHSAGRKGNLDCIELLLARRVKQRKGEEEERSCPLIDEQDCQEKTPLHLAVEGGFSPVIEALIEAGADLNIQTKDGKTCLHLVVTLWGSPEHPAKKVQTTNGFEPVVSRYPQYEPLTDNEKLLLYLLDKGARCTTFDANGDTPIHCITTHRLWQLVVSRIPEEERNDLLDELDVESKRIKRTVQQVIGPEGGEINLSRYGVHLTIPLGALEKDQDISMRLLETFPVPGIQGEEMMASFGVELKPGGLTFKHPAQIKLPHCASVVDTKDAKVVLYHFRGGELATTEVTAGNLAEIPACTLGEKELELYIDDFCYYWPAFPKSWKGREMICLPYSNRAPVGFANLRFYLANDLMGVEQDLSNSATLRDVKRIGDPQPFFVKWNSENVHVAVMNDKREDKTESIRTEDIRHSNQTFRDFTKLKTEHYEELTIRVFQGRETRIVCNNPLEKAPETEAPGNEAEGSAQRVTQLQLFKLSEIISHEKYTELCVRLKCSLTSADNILAKHVKDSQKALLEVLNAWHQRTGRNHRDKLIQVLEEAEVAGLITQIFPDYVHEH